MRAQIKNHRSDTRTPLHDVIPLETPYRLHIEVSNLCNFRCIFCPPYNSASKMDFARKNMSFEVFKKIIDDARHFPDRIKKLYCHNFGEPLINRELPRMIGYAKDQDIAEQIELITNGSLLSPRLNRELVKSGVDHICISVEALNEAGYMEIAKCKIDFKEFVAGIRDLYENKDNCTIYIKIPDIAVKTSSDKEYFYSTFGDICDSIFIENIVDQDERYDYKELKNIKSDFDRGQYGEGVQDLVTCPNIFFMITVNSDGTVSPCCVDWKRQLLLGDVMKGPLPEIWNGSILHKLQLLHLEGNRYQHDVCGKCNYLKYSTDPRDNIDEHAAVLLQRLTNQYRKR